MIAIVCSEDEITAGLNGRQPHRRPGSPGRPIGSGLAKGIVLAVTDQDRLGHDGALSGRGSGPVVSGPVVSDTAAGEAAASGRVDADSPAAQAGAGLLEMPAIVSDTGRLLISWARARSLTPSAVCGISVALVVCATGWLTAGTRAGNLRAVIALWAGYLVLLASRALADRPGTGLPPVRGVTPARAGAIARTKWLTVQGWWASESLVYAGLALGAAADHWPGTWVLAISVLGLVAVRELMTASAWPTGELDAERGPLWRAFTGFLRMPAGGRMLLVGVIAPAMGSRVALLALLDWAIIAIGFGLASQPGPAPEHRARVRSDRARAREARRQARDEWAQPTTAGEPPPAGLSAPASLAVILRPASPGPIAAAAAPAAGEPASTVGGSPVTSTVAEPVTSAGDEVPVPSAGPGPTPPAGDQPGEPAPGPADPGGGFGSRPEGDDSGGSPDAAAPPPSPAGHERVVMLRDDGVLAGWLGELVRGNLLPLPPAVLGLVATAVLAHLGLQSLPGILTLAPCLIMLLAAPGSSNPHVGRLDWLVPAVLLGWQFLYLTTVGQAQGVPGAATFALCAALALRYAERACPGRPVLMGRPWRRAWAIELSETDRERGTMLGWEGRMLLIGMAAAVGIGTFAYLAMTAYLVVLVCGKIVKTCLVVPGEGDGR